MAGRWQHPDLMQRTRPWWPACRRQRRGSAVHRRSCRRRDASGRGIRRKANDRQRRRRDWSNVHAIACRSAVSPSFLHTTPAKKPRTECCCQPVSVRIAPIVVPLGCFSSVTTASSLLPAGRCRAVTTEAPQWRHRRGAGSRASTRQDSRGSAPFTPESQSFPRSSSCEFLPNRIIFGRRAPAHNQLVGGSSPPSPTTQSQDWGDFPKVHERPRIGRDSRERPVSALADLGCNSPFGGPILWAQNPVSRQESDPERAPSIKCPAPV
jgi:hypothetical protein